MKRKRVIKASKDAGKKAHQQEFMNDVDHVTEENSESDESNDSSEESDSELEGYTSPSSPTGGDGYSGNEDTDSDGMEKVVHAYGKAKSRTKSLPKKAEKVKLNKKAKGLVDGYCKAKLKELDSLGRKQKRLKIYHQEPRYCKKELKVASEVITKVMKMDEAEPFNVPVDPIASGKHDYYDVINTPMDFTTICKNLKSGVEYMNAKDVLKDVQIIWENCYTYNKKGDCILILMKRVKKKFMKYWTAAGLCSESARKSKEESHILPPTDFTMKRSRHEPRCQLGSTIGSTSQMQLDNSGHTQLQLQFPSSCCSQPYQLQQPQPSTTQPQSSQFHGDCDSAGHFYMPRSPMSPKIENSSQCQPRFSYNQPYSLQLPKQSSNQVKHFQLQAGMDNDNADFAVNHCEYMPQDLLGSMTSTPTKSKPQKPQLSYNQPYFSQQSNQKPTQTHPSALSAGANIGNAKHSHLQASKNHVMRHNERVPKVPVDPVVVNLSQLQPQQTTPNWDQPNELQEHLASFGQTQPSQPQPSTHIDCADSPIRDSKNTQRCLDDPMVDSPRKQLQVKFGPNQSLAQRQQASLGLCQLYESHQPLQKKSNGRGPTRCLFLKDMRDDERITVPIDSLGEPIGPEAAKLGSFLGIIARNGYMAPLTYVSWKAMPEEAKENMWDCIQSRFIIDPRCKTWILKSLGIKWRNWKALLKESHYYPHQSDEDRLKDRDPRVLPDQWPILISYWSSEKEQIRSAKNKANRAKQKSVHTTGKKSYARLREEERLKRPNGEKPTPEELYVLTHTNKNGQPVNEDAATKISQLQEQANQQKSLKGSDNRDDKGRQSANGEVSVVLKKLEAMEQKYAHIEALIARLTLTMERLLDEKHVSGFVATSKTVGTKQVPNTSNALEDSTHSSS